MWILLDVDIAVTQPNIIEQQTESSITYELVENNFIVQI